MYDKGDVIRAIGYHNWAAFEMFMIGRYVEYDEDTEFPVYTGQDIDDFKLEHEIV